MSGRSSRGRGGVSRARSAFRSHSSSGNVTSTSPSSMPSSSGTQTGSHMQDQYQFVPRTGYTGGFQQEDPTQQAWVDPVLGSQGVGHPQDGWDYAELLSPHYVPPPQEQEQQQEAQPSVTIRTLLETEGRAERLIVLNPDPDAPPHTRWPGRDSGSWISRRITQLLHKAFDGPWYSWKKFPQAKKDQLLYDFAQWYHWDYDLHHGAVVDMVNKVGLERLKDMVHNVRKSREQPTWIVDTLWQQMTQYWDSADARKRSTCYSANRQSERDGCGMAKHVGGSKSFDQHETDMVAELGRPVSVSEVFRKTHFKNGKFVDQMAEKVVKTYEEAKELRQSQADPELTSDGRTEVPVLTQDQDDEIFIQASASLRPGPRAYGIPKRRALSADGSSSSRPSGWTAMADEVAAMKERNAKLEEEVRQIAAKRQEDEQAMERVRLLLAHPALLELAASLATQQPANPSANPSQQSQSPTQDPPNPPQ